MEHNSSAGVDSPRPSNPDPSATPPTSAVPGFLAAELDHPDSPIRKRPRLHEDDQPDSAMSEGPADSLSSLHDHHDPHTPPSEAPASPQIPHTPDRPISQAMQPTPTPCKITTLNLKSSRSDSSLEANGQVREPVSDPLRSSLHGKEAEALAQSQDAPQMSSTIPSPSDSPLSSPPDDIQCADAAVGNSSAQNDSLSGETHELRLEIGEPEDVDSDNPEPVMEISQGQLSVLDVMEHFPVFKASTGRDAANLMAAAMERGDIPIGHVQPISAWLDEWTTYVHSLGPNRGDAYIQSRDLWESVGIIMQKFTQRRSNADAICRNFNTRTAEQVLEGFFTPYVKICGHLIHLDRVNLTGTSADSASLSDLVSLRHLQNLYSIFNNGESSMWNMAWKTYGIQSDEVQLSLVKTFIDDDPADPSSLRLLTDFGIYFSDRVDLWPALKELLPSALSVVSLVGSLLSKYTMIEPTPEEQVRNRLYSNWASGFAATAASKLISQIPTQPATFSTEWNKETIKTCSTTLLEAAKLDDDKACQLFNLIDADSRSLELNPQYYPEIVCNDQRLNWTMVLLKRGRLELRVTGVIIIQDMLLQLHAEYFVKQASPHLVLLQMASLLLYYKVMDHILKVDSHPQIIHRSGLILAFLHITNRYPPHLTDRIWDLATESPDPRIVSATLQMMHTCLQHIANSNDLIAFCKKFDSVPFEAYTPELIRYFESHMDTVSQRPLDDFAEADRLIAPLLCLRLIQQSSSRVNDDASARMLHTVSLNALHSFSVRTLDQPGRRKLYVDCIAAIKTRTTDATGSVEALYNLLYPHTADDVKMLIDDMNLPTLSAEDICEYVNEQRSQPRSLVQLRGLNARFDLFKHLQVFGPSLISSELLSDLWDHTVSIKSLDYDDARNQAWSCFCDIISTFGQTHELAERFINDYLPKLERQYFTYNMCQFLQAANQYRTRTVPSSVVENGDIIVIPLENFLWTVLLTSNDQLIVQNAIKMLSYQYLDDDLIRKAPKLSIDKTHAALIEKSISQLQIAATKLKEFANKKNIDEDEPMHNDSIEVEVHDAELRFIHIVQFLRTFLIDVTARAFFKTEDSEDQSLSRTLDSVAHLNGDVTTIRFQAFESGNQMQVHDLTISLQAPLSTLYAKILDITGFMKASVIIGGRLIDIANNSTDVVASLRDRGNMLVKNIGGYSGSPKLNRESTCSVAEKELFRHFNELYDLLELNDEWSRPILEILHQFPPHPRVYRAVISENTPIEELFPEGRMVKCYYSLRSMRNHLQNQMKSGTIDDNFLRGGVRILTTVLTGSQVENILKNFSTELYFIPSLLDCLVCFLKEYIPNNSDEPYFADPGALVERLCQILEAVQTCSAPNRWNEVVCNAYSALIEASLHELEVWASFTSKSEGEDLHLWLLLENNSGIVRRYIQTAIENVCAEIPMPVAVQRHEFAAYYWQTLSSLVPKCVDFSSKSEQLLNACASVLRVDSSFQTTEASLRTYIAEWGNLLLAHAKDLIAPRHEDDVDIFVLGITKLLSTGVLILKSLKKPLRAGTLIENIFTTYLFPETSIDYQSSKLSFPQSALILDSDTRKELYDLVMALCHDSDVHLKLVRCMADLVYTICTTEEAPFNSERAAWMRSTAGYLGLRNLAHTCYINSLMAQLFMNGKFRNFLMGLDSTRTSDAGKLLLETQRMFGYMTTSTDKYVDTADFVGSIKPFDADHIDPSIQMDVDEFYNLLFERWEEQMPSDGDKKELRSFFGGELVTQIRSMQCEHVSEKLEHFLAIQCEVKGKANLTESLQAYVEGDAMEGDNKYKCESCGGQFVNAVKRSCLKEVPDNLVFHLKRFDFDIQALQRMKINDRFEFPDRIDMTPYTVQYLSDEHGQHKEDHFVLTGVLVHAGNTESGHYYSLIRLGSPDVVGYGTWAEFNDTHVNLIDSRDIPSMAFGGADMSPGGRTPKGQKVWNAYMLFYKRHSAIKAEQETTPISPVAAKNFTKFPDASRILRNNQTRSFRYCLFDPMCSSFMRSLLTRMKDLQGGVCSESHIVERETLRMFLDYYEQVIVRIKDCPRHIEALDAVKKIALNCPTCASIVIEWITQNSESAQNLLFKCPIITVRSSFVVLIVNILRDLRGRYIDLYGLDIENMNDPSCIREDGAFPTILKFLEAQVLDLSMFVHRWESYFMLLREIANFGWQELSILAANNFLKLCIELLLLEYLPEAREAHPEIWDFMRKASRKNFKYNEIIRLLGGFLSSTDIFGETIRDPFERIQEPPIDGQPENRISLTPLERGYIELYDSQGRQLCLVGKILEAWDEDSERCVVPCSIVATLLRATPSPSFLKRLTITLRSGIDNYLPTYLTAYLEASVVFCQFCRAENKIRDIIDAVAISCEDLENHTERRFIPIYFRHWKLTLENDWVMPQGGWDHITTLESMSRLKNITRNVERPYMQIITQLAPRWGPPLLLYDGEDEGQVRTAAYGLLQDLIYSRFELLQPDDEGPSEDMMVRVVAANEIWEACIQKIQDAIGAGLPKHLIEFLSLTCKESHKFLRRLTQLDHPEYDELREKINPQLPPRWLTIERILLSMPEPDEFPIPDESDEYEDSFETEDELAGRI